jgi:transposase
MARIVAKRRGQETYYYYHAAHRVKISPSDRGGKGPGSGPSRVVSEDIYLGTADAVLKAVREGPKKIAPRAFGLVMAAHAIVEEIGVREIVDELIPRKGSGLSVGTYIALAVVAKVAAGGTSWRGFGAWVEKTTLARVLKLPRPLLDSQNFWDAFDRILPEAAHRKSQAGRQEPVLDDEIVLRMEERIVQRMLERYPIDLSTLLLDYTNFFTYAAAENPSRLLKAGHNKAGRHEKRQVNLALVATRQMALPLLHLTYPGNWNDHQAFPEVLVRLVERLETVAGPAERKLVFDRGQNSAKNLRRLAAAQLKAVGGLIVSQHRDLLKLPVCESPETIGDLRVLRTEKKVYGGFDAAVVILYSEKLARKQHLVFDQALRRLQAQMRRTYQAHREDEPQALLDALQRTHEHSRLRSYLDWDFRPDGTLTLRRNPEAWRLKQLEFGKRLLFSTQKDLSTQEIVTLYNQDKQQIESDFHLIKSPDILRFSPMRHFTDTKIRLYGFVCVIALMVFKLMQFRARELQLSPDALVSELSDIQEIVLVYSVSRARRTLSDCSTIQQRLLDVFDLHRFLPTD